MRKIWGLHKFPVRASTNAPRGRLRLWAWQVACYDVNVKQAERGNSACSNLQNPHP